MCPLASSPRVSFLLANWRHGNRQAQEALIPLVYDELRRIAHHHLWHERPGHPLESAAPVHEAYLRLVCRQPHTWQKRTHFLAVAARLMRQILVDHVRKHRAAKRGAGFPRLTLNSRIALPHQRGINLLGRDDALNCLAVLDPRQSRIIELRFFAGLSIEETAIVLGISPSSAKREWTTARAWLLRKLRKEAEQ